jgi:hypothetical protein
MATARVTGKQFHPAAFERLKQSDRIGNNMLLRGLRVESRAKVELTAGPPRRVDTGRLRSSLFTRRLIRGGLRGAMVGTNVSYSWWVHYGTGIYGPHRTVITPVRAKVLVFVPKGGNRPVFAKYVSGMRPNPFLINALPAARLG